MECILEGIECQIIRSKNKNKTKSLCRLQNKFVKPYKSIIFIAYL